MKNIKININKSLRFFTLLEMMVGLALLTLAAGAIGWRLHGSIAKKRFSANISRIQVQLESCYRLAINTHADWHVLLELLDDRLVVRAQSTNGTSLIPFQPRTLPLDPMKMMFNGEETEKILITFSPTGKVLPDGVLSFSKNDFHQQFKIPELFQRFETIEREGPIHPDDVSETGEV